MEPIAASSNATAVQIPAVLVRTPGHQVVIGLLLVSIGVVELVMLGPPLGLWDWWARVGFWFVFGSCFLLSHLTHSITVTRDVMVLRGWFRAEAIRTNDFVSIERSGSGLRRSANVITKHGSVRAPWYHPNLSAAVRNAIDEIRIA